MNIFIFKNLQNKLSLITITYVNFIIFIKSIKINILHNYINRCNKQIYLIRLDIHLMSQNNKLSKIQKERIRKWIKKMNDYPN